MQEVDKKEEAFKSGRLFLIAMAPVLVAVSWSVISPIITVLHGSWFLWHPVAMTVAVLILSVPSILIRQMKGRWPTKLHGFSMLLACVFFLFGWYVIHTTKASEKRAHFTSLHGQLGAVLIFSILFMSFTSFIALEPDYKVYVPKPMISYFKMSHKWGGRLLILLMLGVFYSGAEKLLDSSSHNPLLLSLLVVALVSLRPIFRSVSKRIY
jgi:Eukaryotic cytochrome b561